MNLPNIFHVFQRNNETVETFITKHLHPGTYTDLDGIIVTQTALFFDVTINIVVAGQQNSKDPFTSYNSEAASRGQPTFWIGQYPPMTDNPNGLGGHFVSLCPKR